MDDADIKTIMSYTTNMTYGELNLYLRSFNFSSIILDDLFDWRITYAKKLLLSLQPLPLVCDLVYRGVKHRDTNKVGSLINYKQFFSASTDK